MKHNIALLLAGGQGLRSGQPCPKQYVETNRESVLLHTMRAFEQHGAITDIYVVCQPAWNEYIAEQVAQGHIRKFRACIAGGETGYDSICAGINHLQSLNLPDNTIVLVHDSVRPLITQHIIADNIAMCRTHGNAITALNINEALVHTSDDGHTSASYQPRDDFRQAQTPHTFFLTELTKMVEEAAQRGIGDLQSVCVLANETGHTPLHLVPGSVLNFKITTPEDFDVYRAMLNHQLR